ncbi:hypothetical protein V1478_004447 [Vespula squamosa]|uniref:Uncharacterized protein n=1 Tax=Vespula squamosa TaxID=30214 RepID=A0ABD2BGK7_VESSQ
MDFTNELRSSEEFCFDTVHDEIRRIYKKISGTESDESDEDDGIVVAVRTRKIRVIDSESESDSDVPQTFDKLEWTACHESKEVPLRIKSIPGERSARPQVPSDVSEPLNFFMFFTEELNNNRYKQLCCKEVRGKGTIIKVALENLIQCQEGRI